MMHFREYEVEENEFEMNSENRFLVLKNGYMLHDNLTLEEAIKVMKRIKWNIECEEIAINLYK